MHEIHLRIFTVSHITLKGLHDQTFTNITRKHDFYTL